MRKKLDDKSEDGFLTRWSVKKSQLDHPPAVVEDDQEKDGDTSERLQAKDKTQNQALEDPTNEESVILCDEDMPDIENMDGNSDYSGFLSPGVSDGLRRLALRKLFHSEKFNICDGLDDYDDDFRSFAALGDIITSDMKHQMEMTEEKERLAKQQLDTADDQQEAVDDEVDKHDLDEESELTDKAESNEIANDERADTVQVEDDESKA